MTPLFLFSAYEMGRRAWRRERRTMDLWVTLATIFVVIGFYMYRTHNYGGWCVGMRWFVPIMPLFLLYFGLWLDRVVLDRLKVALILVAFAVRTFHVHDALGSPFQFSRWHNWIEGKPNRNRQADKLNLPKRSKSKKNKARKR
jgi:hypothetical protein